MDTSAAAASLAYTPVYTDTPTHASDQTTGHAATAASAAAAVAKRLFSWPDYLVFVISLAIPLVIGVFFFAKGFKTLSAAQFLSGERSMNFVTVALSLIASILNGVFVIGIPAEVHYYGIRYLYQYIGIVIAACVVAHVFVVKYQGMVLTSAYQYVEWRYNFATRMVASCVFCFAVIVFLAVVLYVPALAFQEVTDFNMFATITITGFICVVYTCLGGLRAVIWADAVQVIILVIGLITICVIGSNKMGGGNAVWAIAVKTQRNNFDDFSFDPRDRTSFWSQTLGAAVVFIGLLISNQMSIQRYISVKSPTMAMASVYLAAIMALPLYCLIAIVGLVLHANYAYCDPLVSKAITTGDQIFPLFLMDVLGSYEGVPGLLLSSIFAAALSASASVINAVTAVCLEDFISPAVMHCRGKKLSERWRFWVAIGIVILGGIVTICLSFVANKFTSKIVQATGTIYGVIGGPLAGIFVMGFLLPFCNAWGAIAGMIGGLGITLWVCLGSIVHASTPTTLAIGVCSPLNVTKIIPVAQSTDPLIQWYLLSFAWYGVLGVGACMIIGIVVSLLTGGASKAQREAIRPETMYSVADNCCCYCPLACIHCYRCGVKFDEKENLLELNDNVPNGSAKMYTNAAENGTVPSFVDNDVSAPDYKNNDIPAPDYENYDVPAPEYADVTGPEVAYEDYENTAPYYGDEGEDFRGGVDNEGYIEEIPDHGSTSC